MPYSSQNGKEEFLAIAQRYLPGEVLDFGVGCGTYADLLKPLGVGHEQMTGVEVWEPYIEQFNLHQKYGTILPTNAHHAARTLIADKRRFSVIVIGDMLEHLRRDQAIELLGFCKQLVRDDGIIMISVPIGEYPQGEYMGNPYEAHLDTWHANDIIDDITPDIFIQRGDIGLIGVFGPSGHVRLEPTIAVYMIAKDEKAFIERCLKSVLIEEPDEVVIADTGSTDGTVEFLREASCHEGFNLLEIHVSPWRFDDARNTVMTAVNPDIDLCVSIDADEVLEAGFIRQVKKVWSDYLKTHGKAMTRINHSFQTIWDWQGPGIAVTKHFHERIHARHGYKWIHPVHEKLVYSGEEVIGWCTEALMTQMPDGTKNRSSYMTLLQQAVIEDPSDWKLWSFLAHEHIQVGDLNAAVNNYVTALDQPGVDRGFINLQIAHLSEKIGDHDRARASFAAAKEISGLREVYMAHAEYLVRCGRHSEAWGEYKNALDVTSQTQGYMRREDAWDGTIERKVEEYERAAYDE